jgi:hypothetical protein
MADTPGYSVVTALLPVPPDEFRHMLPRAARHAFPVDPAAISTNTIP